MRLLICCHIRPIEREGKVMAAKIIVYAGEDEDYSGISNDAALNSPQ